MIKANTSHTKTQQFNKAFMLESKVENEIRIEQINNKINQLNISKCSQDSK